MIGFGPQNIQRPQRLRRIGCRLEGQQPHLRTVAMGHDDLMIFCQIGQSQRRNPNIRSLRVIGHRLATFQQGIAAKGNYDPQDQAPNVATSTALMVCIRFSA